ncbi:aminodeoxychorismate/anthranilate synthase component II [Halorussus litoreus]|uniref:aminodeoxychorismate/anthranilate synthase component II n=1 Tax=Halorussus litoreus TaxID=1710536 RepID=UPI000E272A49|nr:aminodeoxychorismate/anthranilate synthase component II [Halorussus litoreus]
MTASANAESVSRTDLNVLFVDNFDSFTYNLVEYTSEYADTEIVRNTASLADVRAADPDAIVVSPGPGHPANDRDVGVTNDVFREVSPEVPTLGVCLGLEAAVYAYGGSVGRAPEPIHGKAFPVSHDGRGVYAGLDQGFRAGRYHSLVATEVPDCFEVTATTEHAVPVGDASEDSSGEGGESEERESEELVMGVRHRDHPIECVQFHPESVLTAVGHDVIRNFLDGVA